MNFFGWRSQKQTLFGINEPNDARESKFLKLGFAQDLLLLISDPYSTFNLLESGCHNVMAIKDRITARKFN